MINYILGLEEPHALRVGKYRKIQIVPDTLKGSMKQSDVFPNNHIIMFNET